MSGSTVFITNIYFPKFGICAVLPLPAAHSLFSENITTVLAVPAQLTTCDILYTC